MGQDIHTHLEHNLNVLKIICIFSLFNNQIYGVF